MIIDAEEVKNIYLCTASVDFRKQLDSLLHLITTQFEEDILDNSLFLFISKDRKKIKIIYYDGTGFWMLMKRMENGRFKVKFEEAMKTRSIQKKQLRYLLEGLKIDVEINEKSLKNSMII